MSITHDRKFAGIWIPAEIWLENSLNALEKILLVEINSLDNENGCTAGNDYFSKFLGVTSIRVSQMIKKLKDEGYIYEASFDGRVRTLKSNIKTIVRQSKDDYKAGLKEIIKQNEENYKAGLKEIINNNNTYNNQFNNKEKTNKKEIPTISILENVEPTVKESLTVEPTCKETLQVESVAGHKNYIHNTQKKSGRDIYTIEFEEFWAKYCEIAKAKNYTAGDKKTANKCYLKVLQKRGHQDIMRVLTIYQEFILLAFENNKHASSWLNAIDWPDFESQIKQYETDIVNLKNKAKQKEQNTAGQKLIQKPVYEVSEEDKKKQEQELIEYANVETKEPEFMECFKGPLKHYFSNIHHSWIECLKMESANENEIVFILQSQSHLATVERNKEKFETIFKREFQGVKGKEFAGSVKYIAWKKS